MTFNDQTLTPNIIVESYESAYWKVYGRDPRVHHLGAQWYAVNGETVHRLSLMTEIGRLRDEAQRQKPFPAPNRSMINRLISRLRNL